MSKEAMKLALKAMKSFQNGTNGLYEGEFEEEIKALEKALAKQEQGEPVAWKAVWGGETKVFLFSKPNERDFDKITPLYAMPKKRNPLTNEQITEAFNKAMSKRPKDASNAETNRLFVRKIEAVIEEMERTPRLDGSLINEGTKTKQEQDEPLKGLKFIHKADIDLAKKREQELGEPVAIYANIPTFYVRDVNGVYIEDNPLNYYTTQQQRKPLTDEQIGDIAALYYPRWQGHEGFARAIEAAHGIKE